MRPGSSVVDAVYQCLAICSTGVSSVMVGDGGEQPQCSEFDLLGGRGSIGDGRRNG